MTTETTTSSTVVSEEPRVGLCSIALMTKCGAQFPQRLQRDGRSEVAPFAAQD